ncbi:4008_t:CDS:2, partial [Funneliformis mosseae]
RGDKGNDIAGVFQISHLLFNAKLESTNNRTIGIVVAFSNDRFLVKAKGSRFRRVKRDDKGKDTLWRISNIRFVIQCKNLRSPYVVRVSQQEIRCRDGLLEGIVIPCAIEDVVTDSAKLYSDCKYFCIFLCNKI